MPWKERKAAMIRLEFVKRALSGKESKTALCREYAISRPTGDKWITRYLNGEPLEDQSRTPKHNGRRTSEDLENMIVALRTEYPVTGSKKIKRILEDRGVADVPCARTIDNILHRHDLITPEASKAATPYKRFEKDKPNDMWQMDFKGNFLMKNQVRCHPLNIIDDRSRFDIRTAACDSESNRNVKASLISAFQEYGMPKTIQCDNGNPWGVVQKTGYTELEVWLMDLDILTVHSSAYHPQTQGKTERFNESFTKECLKQNEFANMAAAQKIFDIYREFYNNVRPHEALGMLTPAKVYHESDRKYPEHIDKWEYPAEYTVRCVRDNGCLSYNGREYFFSYGFAGKNIGIRESHIPGLLTLEYRNFRVARIDTETQRFIQRKIYRLQDDPRRM